MKGVQYLVDENGKPRSVLIDLKRHGKMWEDFQDLLISQNRREEPRESLEQVESRLRKAGKLK